MKRNFPFHIHIELHDLEEKIREKTLKRYMSKFSLYEAMKKNGH